MFNKIYVYKHSLHIYFHPLACLRHFFLPAKTMFSFPFFLFPSVAAIQSAQTLAGRQSSADLPLHSAQFVCQTDLSRVPSQGPELRAHQNCENVYSNRLLDFFFIIILGADKCI
ncbi:hypothetical protein AMECASPLE_004028 [Ameca splendens]|uniref:Secreted protein n=1 Tax=Ameca splendens TaxID=208324 RepID=A0ABV0Y9X9_9TELE